MRAIVERAGLVLRSEVRAMAWGPLAVTTVLSHTIVAVVGTTQVLSEGFGMVLVRRCWVLIAAGATVLLDDGAAATTASAPIPLSFRRAVRAGAIGIALLGAWGSILAHVSLRATESLPAAALVLEAAALVALGLAAAGWASRAGHPSFIAASATLFVLMVALDLMPAKWSLLAGWPGDEVWEAAHVRWAGLLAAALVVCAWQARDPARRPM